MTTLRVALDALLAPDSLDNFVLPRRTSGLSWRRIAVELHTETGVDVTHESLRNWYATSEAA